MYILVHDVGHGLLHVARELYVCGNVAMQYSGTSLIRTPLGPYQTVFIVEVSLIRRLVASMHILTSHTPQSAGLTCITETT